MHVTHELSVWEAHKDSGLSELCTASRCGESSAYDLPSCNSNLTNKAVQKCVASDFILPQQLTSTLVLPF